jgi:hypothetical protein
MKLSHPFSEFKDEGEVLAWFGNARLVKFLNGTMELRGGSSHDRVEAREWISMFLQEAIVRER